MIEIDRFVEECRGAASEVEPREAVLEVVTRAVADASALMRALGEPEKACVQKIHQSPDLTILNLVWGPQMTVMPHDHRMWAVIGIYTGAEDNIFWRRAGDRLEASGARALRAGDAAPLGPDAIHSVTNPTGQLTGAIHVYGGDFFSTQRSEWDPQTLSEMPYDVEKNMRLFAESNARYEAA